MSGARDDAPQVIGARGVDHLEARALAHGSAQLSCAET